VSPREQHLATRTAAGLFDFSFMGLYEFSSEKTLSEVQTRDLPSMQPGQIRYTLVLNGDGSVFNDATVWQMGGERYWLWTGRRSDYARFRAAARDRSGEFAVLALQGPRSGQILAQLVGRELVLNLSYFHFAQKGTLLVARLGYSGELGYELVVPTSEQHSLSKWLLRAGAIECGAEAMNSLRIESGYVIFDREIDGRTNPEELGLVRLVTGSRRFPVRKRLVGLETADRPARPDLPLASLTSECFSPTLGKQVGLGFAPPDAGGDVRLADGRGARTAALPFYDPARRRPRGGPF